MMDEETNIPTAIFLDRVIEKTDKRLLDQMFFKCNVFLPHVDESSKLKVLPAFSEYIVVSGLLCYDRSGSVITDHETIIFRSDDYQSVRIQHGFLRGSFQGEIDHARALHEAGFEFIY